MLSLEKITVRYDDDVALKDVSLTVHSGELVALLGLNGAGKSTLLRVAAGLTQPDSGRVVAPLQIGWCPQDLCLWSDLTCHEHLYFTGRLIGMNHAESNVQATALLSSHSLSDRSNDLVRTLSGGMKRRLSLAISQVNDPGLIILDEPNAGLDLEGQEFLRTRALELSKQGIAVLLSTHDYQGLEALASRIAILQRGTLTSDASPEALIESIGGLALVQVRANHPESYEGLSDLGPSSKTGSTFEVQTKNIAKSLEVITEAMARSGEPDAIRIERLGFDTLVSGDRPGLITPREPFEPAPALNQPKRPRLTALLSLLARRQSRDQISLALTLLTPAFFALFFKLVVQDETDFQAFLPRLGIFSTLMLIFSTSMSVAREFEAATVDRLRLIGVRAPTYFFAVLMAQTGVGLLGLMFLACVGLLLGFEPNGNHLAYAAVLATTAVICSSIGVAVASLARDAPRAFVFGSTVMFLLMLFSGIIFPLPDTAILWPIATWHATLALDSLALDKSSWIREIQITLGLGMAYLAGSFAAFRPRWALNHQPKNKS